jgi:hypothetical protein
MEGQSIYFLLFVIIVPESLATVSHANCQVTLIIYKNIWMSFTLKKWTLFLSHYLNLYTLSMLCRQRVCNERHFITSSLNMQHSTEKKIVIPCILWYTSYTLLIFVVYNCMTQADVRYCIVEWVHEILRI